MTWIHDNITSQSLAFRCCYDKGQIPLPIESSLIQIMVICEASHQGIDGETKELTCVLLVDEETLEATFKPFQTRALLIYGVQRLNQWNEIPAGDRTEAKPTLILVPVHLITQWIKACRMVVPDVLIICNYYGDYRYADSLVIDGNWYQSSVIIKNYLSRRRESLANARYPSR